MDFMYVYTCPYLISAELRARYVQDTIRIGALFFILAIIMHSRKIKLYY